MAKHKEKTWLEATLREFRWSFVVTALAFAALGLVLMLWPDASMHVLCYLVGGALTLYGGFNVLNFVFSRERAFTFELVVGVLTAAIGIFSLISPDSIRDILSIVLGLGSSSTAWWASSGPSLCGIWSFPAGGSACCCPWQPPF